MGWLFDYNNKELALASDVNPVDGAKFFDDHNNWLDPQPIVSAVCVPSRPVQPRFTGSLLPRRFIYHGESTDLDDFNIPDFLKRHAFSITDPEHLEAQRQINEATNRMLDNVAMAAPKYVGPIGGIRTVYEPGKGFHQEAIPLKDMLKEDDET